MRHFAIAGALCAVSLSSCGSESKSSNLSDIYWDDAETRHAAEPDELVWTIKGSGCTASALSADYILTANHCSPKTGDKYKSGAAILNGMTNDIEVVSVAEKSSTHDYSILKIRWLRGKPTEGQKFTPFISTKPEDLKFGKGDLATPLFTVGFPVDRGLNPTYARGYSKKYSGSKLLYNVGSINGNSGGAVWTIATKTLVSMTNSGPHQHGSPGWNNNDPEKEAAWNNGVAFSKIYGSSTLLKQIFPLGDNKFVDENGDLEAPAI